MTKPIAIISDLHYHSWSAFSETSPTGVNSRLQLILNATREAAEALVAAGGDSLYVAGDVFHKRGEVAPSVLNPVMDLYAEIIAMGITVHAIPGNHDLEKNESERLANSITALEAVGVNVYHTPTRIEGPENTCVIMFPWFSTVTALIESMKEEMTKTLATGRYTFHYAVIHAPIDGVLPHLPAHGLDAATLGHLGYDRVFSGHYHNHADMGEGVYSVGALTHQNWGDLNSTAGYMMVHPDHSVTHHVTAHPLFNELTGEETEDECEDLCKGNFIRIKAPITDDSEIKTIRDGVMALGALGVTIIPIRKTTTARAGAASSGTSVNIEDSIKAYLDKKGASPTVHSLALDVLSEARAA